jgi:hypothetical protein
MNLNRFWIKIPLTLLLLLVGLPACRGNIFAFGPEQAAVSAVRNNLEPNVKMVDNSLQVHQTVKAKDDLAVVIMTFKQVRAKSGDETCMYTYEVLKRSIGWAPKSGGGGCWTNFQADLEADIQVGTSMSTSSEPGDLGFSQAYGLVRNPEIVKVKVTWNDDSEEVVSLNNSTFVSFRIGQFEMRNVEGLNEQDEVIYSFAFATAPGKQ